MAEEEFSIRSLSTMLSEASLQHGLNVLAEATHSTVALFDGDGELVIGPVAGSGFVRTIMSTPHGREALIAAHRKTIGTRLAARWPQDPNVLNGAVLRRFAVPIVSQSRRAGTLTIGDRPAGLLDGKDVRNIERTAKLPPHSLDALAEKLPIWPDSQASADRNIAALFTELLAELCNQEANLRTRVQELTTVYNIAGLVAGRNDLQEVLDRTASMVCEVMKVKACSIRLLDEDTGQLVIRAVHNLSEEYLGKGDVTVTENPIDAAAIQGNVVYVADAPNDPRTRYPAQAKAEGIVSGLITGLIYRGKAVGVLRVYTGELHKFSPFEESLLQAVASQAAAAIVNARLMHEAIEAERYARQIAYAGEVQRRMIPAEPPHVKGLEIGALYRPTFNVGGDFYDFISLPRGNLGVSIADVSGKGVPASLQMASLRSALRVHAHFTYDIDQIIGSLNRHACRETKIGEFSTLFYGVLSPDLRRFTYCNAGHEPPLLLRNGRVQNLTTGGMVLGVDPDTTFERDVLTLQQGDVLLLYTDGVVEAMNFADEQFGRERLVDSLIRHADEPSQLIVQNILWDLRRFRGLADRIDDVTMVALKLL